MKRKPTPAQIAARERFAEMARSGAFKKAAKAKAKPKQSSDKNLMISQAILERVQSGQSVKSAYDAVLGKGAYERLAGELYNEIRKTKSNPAKKTVSQKISQLSREGYPQKQAVAIALSEERAGKVRRNPISDIANIIYNQLGANRFAMMTGAKNFVAGDNFLMFSIGKNQSVYNKVRITLTPDDLYDLEFFKMNRLGDISKTQKFEGVYAEQLQDLFTQVTGLYTSMGTMGRRSNPRASNPIVLVTDRKPRKANPVKRLSLKYACIMPEPGGMAYGIDERTPVTIRFSASELKSAYKCYLIPATVRESAGYQRLISKQKEVYMSLAELKQLFRSFV